jgi:CRP-like cAMP-binding protein
MEALDTARTPRIEAARFAGGSSAELLLIGPWERLSPLAARFHAAGHSLLLVPEAAQAEHQIDGRRFHLAIATVESPEGVVPVRDLMRKAGCPWLALDAGSAMAEAYASGAVAVLPAGADSELVERAASTLLAKLGPAPAAKPARSPAARRRRYRGGDPVAWSPEQVLVVEEGALARIALLADGTEALLGFVVAGDLVVEPREDLFAPALFACSEVEVTALPWEAATRLERFPARLRDQLAWTEAWLAARSCLHLEDRLTNILELLARQFGRRHPQGVLVDFRVTHAQLAQAVGATRSTITRLLARLRHEGHLLTSHDGSGERFILRGRISS